jgi:hypothetical protein
MDIEQTRVLLHSAWEMYERVPVYLGKDVLDDAFQQYLK